MIIRVLIEGLLLGGLLVLFCAFGIRNGAVNMAFLYHKDVQDRCLERGLITAQQLQRNRAVFKAVCIPIYFAFVLISVYAVNGARGFWPGFCQMFGILSIVNLIDRLLIDEYWVGHTRAWVIPGTEDLRPYISGRDKAQKWFIGTVGFALLSAILSDIVVIVSGL